MFADGEAHDVAGYQHDRVDKLIPAVATDHRAVVDLLMQRFHRALGAELVDEAEQDAHRHDRGDDHRVGWIAGESRDRRAGEQEQQQRVAKLADQHAGRGDAMLTEDVRPKYLEASGGLGGSEALIGRAERCQDGSGAGTSRGGEGHAPGRGGLTSRPIRHRVAPAVLRARGSRNEQEWQLGVVDQRPRDAELRHPVQEAAAASADREQMEPGGGGRGAEG